MKCNSWRRSISSLKVDWSSVTVPISSCLITESVIKAVKRTMGNFKKLVQRDAVSDLPMRIRLREQVFGLVI